MPTTDVVIIGGGPAGCAAAMRLARAGVAVTVLERADAPAEHRFGETLPPIAKPLLAACGVLDDLERGHRSAVGNESAWGGPALQAQDFIFHPHGHGWHLDRAAFDASLVRRAAAVGASVRRGVRFVSSARTRDIWTLRLAGDSGPDVSARFVIDASGRHAMFTSRQRAHRLVYDDLVAIAGIFEAKERDADSTTVIEAVADGWWYTSAIPGGRRVAVLHVDRDLLAVDFASAPEFLRMLGTTRHVRNVLDARTYGLIGRPRILAANSTRLEWAVGDRWAAAGDAAATFDPLSAQGIMTAIGSGFAVAEAWLQQNPDALDDYAAALDADYADYLATRARHYRAERRWPSAQFWARRQS